MTSEPIDLSLHLWIKPTFFSESCSSKYCSRERRCSGLGTSHEAGSAAPAGPARLGGLTVPCSCGTLVPISPKMCTYL
jgi:hypothetical protein